MGRLFVRAGAPVLWAIRAYWGTSLLLLGAAAMAVIALLPVASLVSPESFVQTRLVLPAIGEMASPQVWGPSVRGPAATQNAAVGDLFRFLLFGVAAVVVVAGITLVCLLLARDSQRTVEMAARRAVGATRRLLAGSALIEIGILASISLILGSGVSWALVRWAIGTWPGRVAPGSLVASVVSVAGLTALFVVCAMVPLVFARGHRISDEAAKPVPRALPAVQLGLSLLVLTAGALLTRHVATHVQAGGASSAGEVFRQTLDRSAPAARAERYAKLLDALDAGKQYDSVSLTATGGIVGLGTVGSVTTDCGQCSEGGIFLPWHVVTATHQFVSADTFHALGVRVLAGRGISRADRWGTEPVAVVSRGLAIRHFQRGEAIGRKILLGDDGRTWHTVVGIVDDLPARGLGGDLQPRFTVYASVLQHPVPSVDLLIRPLRSMPVDGAAVATVRRALMLSSTTRPRVTESELVADELRPLRWFASWIAFEGWALLILACGGTFALIRLWVASLRAELGLRRALGARRRQILSFVLLRAAGIGLGGVAAGLWFGPGVWNALRGVVADLPGWDGQIVTRYALVLLAAVVLGALPAAWRAARTPPGTLMTWV